MSLEIRLILAALSGYRLAQLLVYDEGPWGLLMLLRDVVGVYDLTSNGQPRTLIGRLFTCPYCVGVYTTALMAIPILFPGMWGDWILIIIGLIGAQSFIETIGHR